MNSERGKEMLTFTDWYYQDSKIMKSILDTQGIEIDHIRFAIKNILKQCYVDTATWGLSLWEKELDIKSINEDYVERRQIIKSHLLKPVSITPKFLTDLVNLYLKNKTAKVIEHNDKYYFEIYFDTGYENINWQNINNAVILYKPAHLGCIYAVNVPAKSKRYIGSKIGNLRSYYLKPKLIDNTDIMQKQYNMGKVSNIKYIDIGIAGIISEVNTRSKKYMLANTGQLRETTISIGNFIKPLDFNVKITHAHSFSLYKTNCINPKSLEKANVKAKNTISAKTTNLREYRIKLKEDET